MVDTYSPSHRISDQLHVTKAHALPDGSVLKLRQDVFTSMLSDGLSPVISLSLTTHIGSPLTLSHSPTRGLHLDTEAALCLMKLTQLLTSLETISLSRLDIGKLKEFLEASSRKMPLWRNGEDGQEL